MCRILLANRSFCICRFFLSIVDLTVDSIDSIGTAASAVPVIQLGKASCSAYDFKFDLREPRVRSAIDENASKRIRVGSHCFCSARRPSRAVVMFRADVALTGGATASKSARTTGVLRRRLRLNGLTTPILKFRQTNNTRARGGPFSTTPPSTT